MKEKLAALSVEVPYKRAGGVIFQQPVDFDFYRNGETYILVPLLDGPELAVANLPTELCFKMQDGRPVSLRGPRDGNFHVIKDAVEILRTEQAFSF